MTKVQIQAVLESVCFWPQEDQEELAELAREIEARRKGVYVMDDEERAAVEEALEQARRGEFVPDDEMDAFWPAVHKASRSRSVVVCSPLCPKLKPPRRAS